MQVVAISQPFKSSPGIALQMQVSVIITGFSLHRFRFVLVCFVRVCFSLTSGRLPAK